MEKLVLPIHFEDRSGLEFERLVLAYVCRLKEWEKIEWLGQIGGDGGRDIWAMRDNETFCYQCANYQKLTLKKVTDDIDKLIKGKTIPDNFIVVCGGKATPDMRDNIIKYANSKSIKKIAIWNGVEFEEKLRKDNPEILKRFVDGEAFPDLPSEIIKYAKSFSVTNDNDIVDLIIECFDRPAFTTRFMSESSIPDFEKAIIDTIEVLNTGVHRLRDGTMVRKIPSRHRITDNDLRAHLADITKLVIKLRDNFVSLKRSEDIRPCGCSLIDCSTYILTDKACDSMDNIRLEIFAKFRMIKTDLNLQLD
jgi:hypothetical protein